jgi:pimeloyl-ACP methyl ester carboxylesterase
VTALTAATLHREVIASGSPTRWLAMTHGIYGTGGNWRSIARQVVNRRPEWGAILLDLRGHGKSEDGAPPHDLAACARDVLAAVRAEADAGHAVHALCGHSFGGKVMLATRAAWPDATLAQTWMLDSSPSPRPLAFDDRDNSVIQVLDLLERLPPTWRRRADFVAAVGHTSGGDTLPNWLAMSLVPDGEQLRIRFDVAQLRALLADYFAQDLWPAVEDPALPGDVRFVIAERSDTVSVDDRARAGAAPRTTVDVVPTGHWLHLEAPAAVVELIASGLPSE